jgi:hypothetical protein
MEATKMKYMLLIYFLVLAYSGWLMVVAWRSAQLSTFGVSLILC